jgi:hypothetical protein
MKQPCFYYRSSFKGSEEEERHVILGLIEEKLNKKLNKKQ